MTILVDYLFDQTELWFTIWLIKIDRWLVRGSLEEVPCAPKQPSTRCQKRAENEKKCKKRAATEMPKESWHWVKMSPQRWHSEETSEQTVFVVSQEAAFSICQRYCKKSRESFVFKVCNFYFWRPRKRDETTKLTWERWCWHVKGEPLRRDVKREIIFNNTRSNQPGRERERQTERKKNTEKDDADASWIVVANLLRNSAPASPGTTCNGSWSIVIQKPSLLGDGHPIVTEWTHMFVGWPGPMSRMDFVAS